MGDKLPQPTATLIKRLRRAARGLRRTPPKDITDMQALAWANTCDQAAGRLEDLSAGKLEADLMAKTADE